MSFSTVQELNMICNNVNFMGLNFSEATHKKWASYMWQLGNLEEFVFFSSGVGLMLTKNPLFHLYDMQICVLLLNKCDEWAAELDDRWAGVMLHRHLFCNNLSHGPYVTCHCQQFGGLNAGQKRWGRLVFEENE